MSGEVIFMNRNGQQHSTNGRGLQSFDGERAVALDQRERVKSLSHPVRPAVKTDEERKSDFEKWFKMKPVYFPTWAWELACTREPHKYKLFLPVYQGQKVILT